MYLKVCVPKEWQNTIIVFVPKSYDYIALCMRPMSVYIHNTIRKVRKSVIACNIIKFQKPDVTDYETAVLTHPCQIIYYIFGSIQFLLTFIWVDAVRKI